MTDLQKIKGAALEEVFLQMPAAAVVVEAPSGKIILVNEQARRTVEGGLGGPMPSELAYFSDLHDSGDFEMLRPDGRAYEPEEWPLMRSIASGEEVTDEIADFVVGDTRTPVLCNSSPIYDDEGRLVAGVVVFWDITGEKRAEEALRESSKRTEGVLESITEDFIAVDREWRLTYASEQALGTMLKTKGEELAREEFLGSNIWELYPGLVGGTLYEKYHEAMREHKTVEFEAYFSTSDTWHEVRAYPSEEGLSIYSRDITGRKRAEEQLAYHARLLENLHDAVIATDERFVVTAWNRGAERMFGWRADEALGRAVYEVIPTEISDERMAQTLRELTETGRFRDEFIMYGKDGTPVYTETLTVALRGEQGETTGYVNITRDITERKRAEEELRQSEERFRGAFEDAPIGVALVGLDGRRFRVNRALCEMLGYTEEELLGKDYLETVHPEDRETSTEHLRRVLEGEGPDAYALERRYLHAAGHEVWNLSSVSLIRDSRGGPSHLVCLHQDITERKRAEEALRESERHLRFVLEAAGLGAWELDFATGELRSSEGCNANFGLPPEADLSYERLFSMMHPDDRGPVREAIDASIASGIRYEVEYRITTPGGETRWIIARGRVVCAPDGSPTRMAGITLDITRRKRDEEKLRESSRRIEDILESITDGFYAMDHRWRFTYLNARAVRFASRLAGEEFTREGLLGRTLWETLPAIVGTSIDEQYRRAVREQRTVVFEYPYPGDGPCFEVHAYPSEQGLSIYFRDITERKRAEEEIEARARQQAAVAELGLRASANGDLQSFMDEAVALLARTLGVEYAKIVDPLPGGEEELLVVRAGVGWKEGVVGSAEEAALDPQSGHTLLSGEPVIVEDLGTEARFGPAPVLREHGVVSAVTAVIPATDGPFGVLGAYATSRRAFSEDDVNFLRAVANVLATALEREESEERMSEIREAERGRMARDLHDEALGDLAYALAEAQLARSISKEAAPAQRLGRLVAALKRVGRRLRAAIYDLRLGEEQDKPFSELLGTLVGLHRQMAPECDVRLEVGDGVLSGPLGETGRELLRIVGEALTNARRHSGARGVRVAVWTSEGRLRAEVSDDGRGFDPARESSAAGSAGEAGGMGIRGMSERARALGGDLKIESEPGKGTKVRFGLDLREDREQPEEGGVRVLLVEDHAAVREAIASSFGREAGFEVAGQAGSLAQAREVLARPGEEEPVDVAVIDLGLPDGYGGDLIADLRQANPRAQALVLSASLDRREMARAVEAGAAGFLHKTAHLGEVAGAVRRLRAGETLVPLEEVVELLRFAGSKREEEHEARRAVERLTPREKEVLRVLAEGLDSKGIAGRLNISVRTERNHVASILAKLGAHSRLQALVFALRHGVAEIS